MSTEHEVPTEPHNAASAQEALARAQVLESRARRSSGYMPVYFIVWALLNIALSVGLWLWAAAMPPGGGGPYVFWFIPLILAYLAGLAALIVWAYRGRTTRPKAGPSTTLSVIANGVCWPLGMTIINAQHINDAEPLLRGIGFLAGGILSAVVLMIAAVVASREAR